MLTTDVPVAHIDQSKKTLAIENRLFGLLCMYVNPQLAFLFSHYFACNSEDNF